MGSVGLVSQVGARMGFGAFVTWVGAAVARRFRVCRNVLADQRRTLLISETSYLGQNRAIHLVTVGRRSLLIGSTASSIALLADVSTETSDAPRIDPAPASQVTEPAPFAAVLSQVAVDARHHVHIDAAARLRSAADAIRGIGGRN